MKPRLVGDPSPGYFLVKLVRGGVLVPAAISHDFGLWSCSIQGNPVGEPDPDPSKVEGLFRIWHWGQPITQAEYQAALRRGPASDPTKPIDLGARAPLF